MSEPAKTRFTAAEIARVVNLTAQAVRQRLATIPHNGEIVAAGNPTKAWLFCSLPPDMRGDLQRMARRRGFRDAEDLLSDPSRPWQPPIPLAECLDHVLEGVLKMRRALQPSLERQHQPGMTKHDLERLGLEDYRREFGHCVTLIWWWELIRRVEDRDRGARNYSRQEIYLPLRPPRKPDLAALKMEDSDLSQLLIGIVDVNNLSDSERQLMWLRSFEWFEDGQASGVDPKSSKERLFQFVMTTLPTMARTRNALRMAWQRKYQLWLALERTTEAVVDGRIEANRQRSKFIPVDYVHTLAAVARKCYEGKIEPAMRYLRATGEIPSEVTGTGQRTAPSLRQLVAPLVKMTEGLGLRGSGKRRTKLTGDKSAMFSLDRVECDDMTPNFYCYIPDGKDWWSVIRPQTLISVDCKSSKILAMTIVPSPSYGGENIFSLLKATFRIGFPLELGLENASWKTSRFIHGRKNGDLPSQSLADIELGLSRLISNIVHAQGPTGKSVIEGSIGAIQKLMPPERGFCGRDERRDCPEETRLAKLAVESQREHPGKFFYTFERFVERMHELWRIYDNLPQQGDLGGLTPAQAFEKFQNPNDPPVRLDETNEHILDYHPFPRRVTRQGISFSYKGETLRYFGSATSPFQEQIVTVYFDPEAPEAIRFKPSRSHQIYTIERHTPCKRGDKYMPDLQKEIAKANAHDAYPRAVHKSMELTFNMRFRPNLTSPLTVSEGRQIKEQNAALDQKRTEGEKLRRRRRTLAAKTGVPLAAMGDSDEAIKGAEMELEGMRELGLDAESPGDKS